MLDVYEVKSVSLFDLSRCVRILSEKGPSNHFKQPNTTMLAFIHTAVYYAQFPQALGFDER